MEKDNADISTQLENLTQKWIEYLIENYKNPNKVNSCLDVASENIRLLESIINQSQTSLKVFKTLKELTLANEQKRLEQNNDSRVLPTLFD